jgi:hypothetical protein
MVVKHPPVAGEGTVRNEQAGKALKYALIGIFCFGFILGPIAISKAFTAKREIKADPKLDGKGKVAAALMVGTIDIVQSVMYFFEKVASA